MPSSAGSGQPRGITTSHQGAPTEMTAPDRTYDQVRFHRGSRGFAAFVTGLNASILLGLALFVTPTLGLTQPAARARSRRR